MNFHIISIFPNLIEGYFSDSILKKAIASKKIKISFYNPSDFLEKSQKNNFLTKPLDDKPYGGGPGMVLKVEPFLKAIKKAIGKKKEYKIIHFSPFGGKVFDTKYAKKLAEMTEKKGKEICDIILVCGRYEGIDSRIEKIFPGDKVSIGPYVLTGGEIASLVLIDCISRQISGVLGNNLSKEEERISSSKFYTKPETIIYQNKKYIVPKILLSGNHKEIEKWRKKN